MERLNEQRPSGIGRTGLRIWGLMFLVLGIVSRSVLQYRILGMGSVSAQQLLEAMQSSQTVMIYATVALVLQALEACAIPVFAALLAEGMKRTRSFGKYFLRVTGTALVTELPYNWATSGKLLDFSTRNPMFGLVFAMIVVYYFQRYGEKGLKNRLIQVIVAIAAVLWCSMLRIEYGGCMVVTVLVLWLLWDKPLFRSIGGTTALLASSVFSPFLMAAPMSFLAVHYYNGTKSAENRVVNYLAYPALLLIAGIAGSFLV